MSTTTMIAVHSNNNNNNQHQSISSITISNNNNNMNSTHSDDNNNNNNNIYLIDHLHFMQEQEENFYHPSSCPASFPEDRRIMASWSYDIVDACSIDRELACIGMSYFDRFICTPVGRSTIITASSSCKNNGSRRRKFQLAFLTCLVIALKVRGGMQVDSPFVSETICQGMYSPQEIVQMESIILKALQWRLNGPSPQEFIVGLLHLLPSTSVSSSNHKVRVVKEKLKTLAYSHVESSMLDYTMAVQLPSRVAYAALLVAMSKLSHDVFSPFDRYVWMQNIALVSGLTTTSSRATGPTTATTTDPREKHYGAARSMEVRRQREQRQQLSRGEDNSMFSPSLSTSPSSSSSYYYPTSHDNVVSGHVIDDDDTISDYEMSVSCSSSSTSGVSGVHATPDRQRGGGGSWSNPAMMLMMIDPTPETSIITEYYCSPVGSIGGSSCWNQQYCTPISNSSSSSMTRMETATATLRRWKLTLLYFDRIVRNHYGDNI